MYVIGGPSGIFMGCMVWSLSGGLRIVTCVWCYVGV